MFVQTEVEVGALTPGGKVSVTGASGTSPWYLKALLALAAGICRSDRAEAPHHAMGQQRLARILLMGLGGGTLASAIHDCMPHVHLEVVEMEGNVVHAARELFGLTRSSRLSVKVMDVYDFLERWDEGEVRQQPFDAVLFDIHTSADCSGEWGIASQSAMEQLSRLLRAKDSLVGIYCGAWPGGDFESDHEETLAVSVAKKMRERWAHATIVVSVEPGDDSCVAINRSFGHQPGQEPFPFPMDKEDAVLLPFDSTDFALSSKILSMA